jgi:hypothetical protein
MKLHQGPSIARRRARYWPFDKILASQPPCMDFVDASVATTKFCFDQQRGGMPVCSNNGGGPGVPLVPRR